MSQSPQPGKSSKLIAFWTFTGIRHRSGRGKQERAYSAETGSPALSSIGLWSATHTMRRSCFRSGDLRLPKINLV